MYIGLHVKYRLFLSDFKLISNFLDIFLKNTQTSNLMKIRLVGVEFLHADRQTWRSLMVDNHSFAHAPMWQSWHPNVTGQTENQRVTESEWIVPVLSSIGRMMQEMATSFNFRTGKDERLPQDATEHININICNDTWPPQRPGSGCCV